MNQNSTIILGAAGAGETGAGPGQAVGGVNGEGGGAAGRTGTGPDGEPVGGMTGAEATGGGAKDEEEEGWSWGGGAVHEGAGGYGGSVSCGVGKKSARIVGGTEAKPEEFPWQVAFRWESNTRRRSFFCGGSLIDKKWVISAAHCFVKRRPPPEVLKVVLGEFDTRNEEGNEVVIAVKNVRRNYI